jgi:nucleotide-binding universal stress UspA family protein
VFCLLLANCIIPACADVSEALPFTFRQLNLYNFLVIEGSPSEAILLAAETDQPDLIVIGSRSGGGLPGLNLGSVAERVVRRAAAPVLVVK